MTDVRTLNSFYGAVGLMCLSLFLVSTVPVLAQSTDDAYRRDLSFNKIKVTRQLGSALKSGQSKVALKTMKIMKPVWSALNEKYPIAEDQPRTLFKDLKSAVDNGNKEQTRAAVMTFLFIDFKDMLELGHGFVKEGNTSRAKVYVKQSLMIYKAVLERNIQNPSEKSESVRQASTGIQQLNQALSSPDEFAKHKESVLEALKTLFPEIKT